MDVAALHTVGNIPRLNLLMETKGNVFLPFKQCFFSICFSDSISLGIKYINIGLYIIAMGIVPLKKHVHLQETS